MKLASIIISIIAGFLGLPAAVCAGTCAVLLSGGAHSSSAESDSAGGAFLFLGVVAAVLAIVGGVLTSKPGKAGPIIQLVAFGMTLLTCLTLNPISVFVALLLLVSSMFGMMKKD